MKEENILFLNVVSCPEGLRNLAKNAPGVRHTHGVFESQGEVPRGSFIPVETLVQNGTAGDNGTALNQPVLGFVVG